MKASRRSPTISIILLLGIDPAHSFLSPFNSCLPTRTQCMLPRVSTTELYMAKKSKTKKKKKASSSSGGLKGFGSSSSSSTSTKSSSGGGGGTIDRSPSALKFYDYLQRNGAEPNLKRVGLGYFPLQIDSGSSGSTPNENAKEEEDVIQLRGVIALRDMKQGDPIIEIPYEMALDLGRESADPTLPATTLLQKYCAWKSSTDSKSDDTIPPGDKERSDYFAMLPPYLSNDCLGSTDFFSDAALEMLQCPMIVDETYSRRDLVQARYDRDVGPMAAMSSNLYRWENEADVATQSHLQWASWIITSRVLTVQGPPETSTANRLLIPLIDMCNHDRDSPHVLTGRAMPGGMLKVMAGADIKSGDAINIGYGGSIEGNDRFIQDYGFLDSGGSKERRNKKGNDTEFFVAEAYKIVAKKLLGNKGRSIAKLTAAEQERELEALKATSLEEDDELLKSGKVVKNDERMALEFRIGMKRALKELM